MQEILIGLVGAGTVGGGVVKILNQRIEGIKKDSACRYVWHGLLIRKSHG